MRGSEALPDGRVPPFVIIPGPLDVDEHTRRLPRKYESPVDHFNFKRYRFLDFLDPLVTTHKGDLSYHTLFVEAHYRGPVNKVLAGEIVKALNLP